MQHGESLDYGRVEPDVRLSSQGFDHLFHRSTGEQVDGMDVRAVRAAGEKAVKWCRSGKGPYILEMKTYRYRGHSMSDPAKYRTKEEVEAEKKRDALTRLKRQLLDDPATQERVTQLMSDVEDEVAEAVRFADESPDPQLDLLAPTTYAGDFAR